MFGTNHIEALTQMFMPHDNVLYGDAMSGDSRFSPNDARCDFYVFIQNFREHINLFSVYASVKQSHYYTLIPPVFRRIL